MNQWHTLAIAIVAIAVFGGLALQEYQEAKVAITAAKAGLEECPNWRSINTHATIWVKDCEAFTKLQKENK